MKHPNKKRNPSSLAKRENSGQLIKIKKHTSDTGDSTISCVGATYEAWFNPNPTGDGLPKLHHAIEVNGKAYNADNSEDIFGKTFQDADGTVYVYVNSTGEGLVTVSAQGLSGGEFVRVKLTPPTNLEINSSGLENIVTGPDATPNNPTISVDEETNVITVCLVAATPT